MSKRNLDSYKDNYTNKDHYDFERFQVQYRRKNVLFNLKKYTHKTILEVGCGVDPLFKYIDDYQSFTVVEPSEEFYSIAEKLCVNDKRISLINDFIENINTEEKFDFIVISSLLHEIKNDELILNSIRSLSHQDTVVYINVPNAKSFHRLLALESGLIDSIYQKSSNQIKFQQSHTYDIDALEILVKNAGFSVIESGSYFLKPFTHKQMHKLLDCSVIDEQILAGLDRMIEHCPGLGSEIFVTCKYIP